MSSSGSKMSSASYSLSPTTNNFIQVGAHGYPHLSDVSIHYTSSTLPTPWPILLAGLLWSLISAVKAMLGMRHVYETRNRMPTSCIVNAVFSTLQFIRCLAAFIGGCIALNSNDGKGRFRPASAVVVLLLSTLPYSYHPRTPKMFRALAGLGTLFAIMTLITMICLRLKVDNDYYAKWIVSSSSNTCPIVVQVPLNVPSLCWQYVGCGLEKPQDLGTDGRITCIGSQNPNTWGLRNRLAFGETVLGLLLLSPLLILSSATIILVPIALAALAWLAVFIATCFKDPFGYSEEPSESMVSASIHTSIVAMVFILVYIAVSFPLHYIQQTHSTGFLIRDSFGPLSEAVVQNIPYQGLDLTTWTGNAINGSSWSDFFSIETPTDRLGFLSFWWNENKSHIENWIAFL